MWLVVLMLCIVGAVFSVYMTGYDKEHPEFWWAVFGTFLGMGASCTVMLP